MNLQKSDTSKRHNSDRDHTQGRRSQRTSESDNGPLEHSRHGVMPTVTRKQEDAGIDPMRERHPHVGSNSARPKPQPHIRDAPIRLAQPSHPQQVGTFNPAFPIINEKAVAGFNLPGRDNSKARHECSEIRQEGRQSSGKHVNKEEVREGPTFPAIPSTAVRPIVTPESDGHLASSVVNKVPRTTTPSFPIVEEVNSHKREMTGLARQGDSRYRKPTQNKLLQTKDSVQMPALGAIRRSETEAPSAILGSDIQHNIAAPMAPNEEGRRRGRLLRKPKLANLAEAAHKFAGITNTKDKSTPTSEDQPQRTVSVPTLPLRNFSVGANARRSSLLSMLSLGEPEPCETEISSVTFKRDDEFEITRTIVRPKSPAPSRLKFKSSPDLRARYLPFQRPRSPLALSSVTDWHYPSGPGQESKCEVVVTTSKSVHREERWRPILQNFLYPQYANEGEESAYTEVEWTPAVMMTSMPGGRRRILQDRLTSTCEGPAGRRF